MSTIRTAHAFGIQHALASLYDVTVQKAYREDCRIAVSQGIGFGIFYFAMYAAYGLGEFGSFARPQDQLIPTH